jgi:hypothetical protein
MPVLLRLLLLVCLMVPAVPDTHARAHAEAAAPAPIAAHAGLPPCHDDVPPSGVGGPDGSPGHGHDCCEADGTSANHDCGCGCGCGGLAATALPVHAATGSSRSRSLDRGAPPPGGRAPLHSAPPVRPPIG